MKARTLQFLAAFISIVASFSYIKAQIPENHPFKTYLDTADNLYITGYDGNFDIVTTKFPSTSTNHEWSVSYQNPGFDRGTDLVLDGELNVFVCGFLKSENRFTDLCILKHNALLGDISLVKKLDYPKEDKFYGIAREGEYFYAAGYTTSRNLKDFFLTKFDRFGDTIWTRTFNNSEYNRDDVATDVLVDGNFVYVIGYTYNGETYKNDIILYTCDLNGMNARTEIVNRKHTNETPTAFIFAKIWDAPPLQKSRTAVVVVTDKPFGQGGNNFLTYYFKDDNTSSLYWIRDFSGGGSSVSIPTAVAADPAGNLYVTGYTDVNAGNGYDFVTMKYNKDDGSYGWNTPSVIFYDSLSGNDKASSVKVKNSRIYIAGTSDSTQNGYYLAAYNQVQGYPQKDFDNVFVPSFTRNGAVNDNMNKAAVVELDSSGNTYLVAQSWNESHAYYAIRKFSPTGEVLYTIDPFEGQFRDSNADNSEISRLENVHLCNYPNPFNPSTKITYKLLNTNYVRLNVFDIAGRFITSLVDSKQNAGSYEVEFNAADLPSGVYYSVLTAGNRVERSRMVLIR